MRSKSITYYKIVVNAKLQIEKARIDTLDFSSYCSGIGFYCICGKAGHAINAQWFSLVCCYDRRNEYFE